MRVAWGNGEKYEKTVKLPENFFLGAAASAWQTEGWSEKRSLRILI